VRGRPLGLDPVGSGSRGVMYRSISDLLFLGPGVPNRILAPVLGCRIIPCVPCRIIIHQFNRFLQTDRDTSHSVDEIPRYSQMSAASGQNTARLITEETLQCVQRSVFRVQ
jgi:hypothetical protein